MSSKLSLFIKINTPTSTIFEGVADKIAMLTNNGMIEILPGHTTLATVLDIGLVTVHAGTEIKEILCFEGLVSVKNNDIQIMTEEANLPSATLLKEIEEAIKMARNGGKGKKSSISVEGLLKAEMQLRYRFVKGEK